MLRPIALVACLLATSGQPVSAQDVRQESGALQELVSRLTSHDYLLRHPDEDNRPFVDPIKALRYARRAASLLAVGEVRKSAVEAARIGYELIEFLDTNTQQRYYLLREDLQVIGQLRGWGAYLLNPNPTYNALVEAPHPLGDSNTAPLAATVFSGGARGLLIAGAHRKKADLPDFVESVFHQVHSAWIGSQGLLPVLQIHGFAAYKHDFPNDAQMILSTGGGQVSRELLRLDRRLDRSGFPSYVYNTLGPDSPRNKRVNGDSPGDRFRSLAATKNMQGRHARGIGGTFMHLEFEYSVRHDPERRASVGRLVAQTMTELAPTGALNAELETPPAITIANGDAAKAKTKL